MKKYLAVFWVAVCFFSGSAWAASITPDVVTTFYTNADYTGSALTNPYLTAGSTIYYQHNILDNGFNVGDTVTSGAITFIINEHDGGWSNPEEKFNLLADGGTVVMNFEVDNGSSVGLAATLLASLSADGILNCVLTVTKGDLMFTKSILNATFTENPVVENPVTETPEPASILLLGLGLIGLARTRRKTDK